MKEQPDRTGPSAVDDRAEGLLVDRPGWFVYAIVVHEDVGPAARRRLDHQDRAINHPVEPGWKNRSEVS